MLQKIYIKNYALIQEIDVEFGPGLNIITGETGAGKSILLGALGMILGGKADTTNIRQGSSKAIIEAYFRPEKNGLLKKVLHEIDDDSENEIIVRRELNENGRSRAFLNDSPINLNELVRIGELTIDLHGQHEHQSLLRVENHIDFLDAFAGLDNLVNQVSTVYHNINKLNKELSDLEQQERLLKEKKDLFEFQLQEIDAVNPKPDEENELLREEKILQNAEILYQKSNKLYNVLYEGDDSVYDVLSNAVSDLDSLSEIDHIFTNLKSECSSAQIVIGEIATELHKYATNIQFDPERLEAIRLKLGQYTGLRKKYGPGIKDVINFRYGLEQDLQNLKSVEFSIHELQNRIQSEKKQFSDLCQKLSEERRKASMTLEGEIVKELEQLGMPDAVFKVAITREISPSGLVEIEDAKYHTTPKGIDKIEFLISANPGLPAMSLAKIASGGEISRVMLALKTVLAQNDRIPVLIFDEIDIGISGHIAQVVGQSLKKLSEYHQVVCITHLPQIASMADHHFVVEKVSDATSTRTGIRYLEKNERIEQIAKLLGGEHISEVHLNSAKALIDEAKHLTQVLN